MDRSMLKSSIKSGEGTLLRFCISGPLLEEARINCLFWCKIKVSVAAILQMDAAPLQDQLESIFVTLGWKHIIKKYFSILNGGKRGTIQNLSRLMDFYQLGINGRTTSLIRCIKQYFFTP